MTQHYRRYGSQIKEMVKEKHQSAIPPLEISQSLNIPYGTVHNWCQRLMDGLDINQDRRGGAHNVKVTPNISRFIQEHIDSTNWITMDDLKIRIQSQFDVTIARSTLSQHVHNKLGYSYKIIRPISEQRNCDVVKNQRVLFVEWLMQQDEYEVNNHFVYIDQSGFWINKFKRRGYAPHSETPQAIVSPRGTKVNVCGAISGQGLVYLEAFTPINRRDNFNSTKYLQFLRGMDRALKNYCDVHNVDYGRIHLIMDNCSIHHSRVVVEGYLDDCPFTVKFLPPWSPMLNPIEEVIY